MRPRNLNASSRILLAASLAITAGCEGGSTDPVGYDVAGGNAEIGARVITSVGCGACHIIPGIDEAEGVVGPPLTAWSRRVYIAGSAPNTPKNLVGWLMDPHEVEPGTAMPDLALTEQQARNVSAYLYTLD